MASFSFSPLSSRDLNLLTKFKVFKLYSLKIYCFHLLQSCGRYDPTATSCMFMRAVSHASVGQFYNAVKVMTRVSFLFSSFFELLFMHFITIHKYRNNIYKFSIQTITVILIIYFSGDVIKHVQSRIQGAPLSSR